MRTWLANGLAALRLAGDRSELWLSGATAWLAYLGWPVLLLTVAGVPDHGDLQGFGTALHRSTAFPANLVALLVAVAAGAVLLMLLAAVAQLAELAPERPTAAAARTAWGVTLLAALPAAAAVGAGLAAGLAVAPREFMSSQLEVHVLLRILVAVWPLAAVFVVLVVVGQALGAVALRAALVGPGRPLVPALAFAARDLAAHPIRRLATAAVGLLADVMALTLSLALLGVLWAPLGADLAAGQLIGPRNLLLLVGFVAIWLVLILVAGALHVARSTWWSHELGTTG